MPMIILGPESGSNESDVMRIAQATEELKPLLLGSSFQEIRTIEVALKDNPPIPYFKVVGVDREFQDTFVVIHRHSDRPVTAENVAEGILAGLRECKRKRANNGNGNHLARTAAASA